MILKRDNLKLGLVLGLIGPIIGFVVIYSAIGLRDPSVNEQLGKAMTSGPGRWQAIKRLRRDHHEPGDSCWLHGQTFCLGM